MHPTRIAIVGLGVAGITAAILLARQGHTITLFEQTFVPGPIGAGVLLQPSGQLVLERMGLLEQVIARAQPIERLHARTHHNKTLINLPYAELEPGISAYGIHRGELFTVLYNELKSTAVTVRLGVRAVRYLSRPTHITVFDDQDNPLQDFDFVIACDGARSALRASSKIPSLAHEYPHGAIWASGKSSAVNGHLLQVTRGTRQLCGLLPTGFGGDDNCSLFWSLRTSKREVFFARGFDAWRQEVLSLCPEARDVFNSLTSFEQTRFTTYMHVRMPAPYDERCLFLGDAAHAMSPHLGQGINLALIDAYTFAAALARADDFLSACRQYANLRRGHLRFYSAVTYTLSPFFQSRGFVKAILRDIFLPQMPRIPPLRKQMLVTMAGLRAGFLGGRIQLPNSKCSEYSL
jgi:2-polyprenyl-6-methoxyphenol hydroxylase-like FAD-dependent oxidoreductase